MVQSALAILAPGEIVAASAQPQTITIIGRSHIVSLQRGYNADAASYGAYAFLQTSSFEPISKAAQITEIVDPFRSELLTRTENAVAAAILIGGNQHIAQSLFRRTPPIDVILSDFSELPVTPDSHIAPERVFDFLFDRTQADLRSVLAFLRAVRPSVRLVVLGPPPPIADAEFLLVRLDPILKDVLVKDGIAAQPSSISPAIFRWKVWHLLNKSFERAALAHEAQWLPPPRDVFDDSGKFLAPQFWGDDATHANPLYGRQRLQQLDTFR